MVFTPDDLELLEKGLSLQPDLYFTIYAARLARTTIKFPIADHAALKPLFEGGSLKLKDRFVTFDQVIQFVPKEFFPIETEDQFLSRILIAFGIHQRSRAPKQIPVADGKTTFVDPGFKSPPMLAR